MNCDGSTGSKNTGDATIKNYPKESNCDGESTNRHVMSYVNNIRDRDLLYAIPAKSAILHNATNTVRKIHG